MPLFHVQDADRPAYVLAKNYSEAEERWRAVVGAENDWEGDDDDFAPPLGIMFVCDDAELLLDSQQATAGMAWSDIAHSAYRAYSWSTGNKNFRGDPMPPWGELPDQIKTAWEAAIRQAGACTDDPTAVDRESRWKGWVPPSAVGSLGLSSALQVDDGTSGQKAAVDEKPRVAFSAYRTGEGVWLADKDKCVSVSRMIAEDVMVALGYDVLDFKIRDRIIAAIANRVDGTLDEALMVKRLASLLEESIHEDRRVR